MNSASVRPIDHPVRYKPPGKRYEANTDVVKGVDGGSGASATDAAVALSQLPVLRHFREGLGLVFAISAIITNFAALVYLVYYFRTSCTNEYGVLPNEPGDFVPPALADLEDQAGVTIFSRSLVYFQTNDTYTQGNLTFWTPFQTSCGCAECNLDSFAATIPIVVEYEQCNSWAEVRRGQLLFLRCTPPRAWTAFIPVKRVRSAMVVQELDQHTGNNRDVKNMPTLNLFRFSRATVLRVERFKQPTHYFHYYVLTYHRRGFPTVGLTATTHQYRWVRCVF